MKPQLIIIGAGGHGRVICDAALREGKYDIAGFVDSNVPVGTVVYLTYRVLMSQKEFLQNVPERKYFIVAIGNNEIRKNIFNELKGKIKPAAIVHPFSSVAPDVTVGNGTVVLAGAVINTGAKIGENTIVNNHSLVDHDVIVADHVHIDRGTLILPAGRVEEEVQTVPGKVYPSFAEIKK